MAGALSLLKLDVETLRGPTVGVSVDEPFARKLPLDMAVNLYRIAQEATTNALRHSGARSPASIPGQFLMSRDAQFSDGSWPLAWLGGVHKRALDAAQ